MSLFGGTATATLAWRALQLTTRVAAVRQPTDGMRRAQRRSASALIARFSYGVRRPARTSCVFNQSFCEGWVRAW